MRAILKQTFVLFFLAVASSSFAAALDLEVWNPGQTPTEYKIAARITNRGSQPIALNRLKVMAWFRYQGTSGLQPASYSNNLTVYNAAGQWVANVDATTIQLQALPSELNCGSSRRASYAAVISFSDASAKSIPVGGYVECNSPTNTLASWHRADWQSFDRSNDYSRIAEAGTSSATRADLTRFTLYVDDTLACEAKSAGPDGLSGQAPCGISACIPPTFTATLTATATPSPTSTPTWTRTPTTTATATVGPQTLPLDGKLSSDLFAMILSARAVEDALALGTPVRGPLNDREVLIMTKSAGDPSALAALLTEASAPIGPFVNGWIRVSQLQALGASNALVRAEAASTLQASLNVSRSEIRADLVQASTACSQNGASVVVGVVDGGVDWRHLDMQSSANVSKIAWLWDQTLASGAGGAGSIPTGYTYGYEYSGALISSALPGNLGLVPSQDGSGGHGTHVASTAAGSGLSDPNYRGIAPGSPLIIVHTDFSDPGIVDGVRYVFQKAAAMGKEAVVNLSLGSEIGAHDGSGMLDQEMNALQALYPQHSIVVAAGNNGGDNFHAHASVPANGSVDIPFHMYPLVNYYANVDAWFAEGASFSSADIVTPCGTFNIPAGTILSGGVGICPGNLAAIINPAAPLNELQNHEHHVRFYIQLLVSGAPLDYTLRLNAIGKSGGVVDVWVDDGATGGSAIYSYFTNAAQLDPSMTIGSPGSAANVITVGSYVSTCCGSSSPGPAGIRSIFSTRGPIRPILAGNLAIPAGNASNIKPDITAPGEMITAAQYNTSSGHWAMQGTSMASPHVTGLAALVKAQAPGMTFDAVRERIRNTARRDAFTGGMAVAWDRDWGFGKADALAASSGLVNSRFNDTNWAWTATGSPTYQTFRSTKYGWDSVIFAEGASAMEQGVRTGAIDDAAGGVYYVKGQAAFTQATAVGAMISQTVKDLPTGTYRFSSSFQYTLNAQPFSAYFSVAGADGYFHVFPLPATLTSGPATFTFDFPVTAGQVTLQLTTVAMGDRYNPGAIDMQFDNFNLCYLGTALPAAPLAAGGLASAARLGGATKVPGKSWLPDGKEFAVMPNPTKGAGWAVFKLDQPATVELIVYGLDGTVARTLPLGELVAGEHRSAIDLSGLSSGVYFALLRSSGAAGPHRFDLQKIAIVR